MVCSMTCGYPRLRTPTRIVIKTRLTVSHNYSFIGLGDPVKTIPNYQRPFEY